MSEAAELAREFRLAFEQMAPLLAPMLAPKHLWTIEDVAAQLHRSIRSARDYVAQPGFPKAIRINGTGHPLYKAAEVLAWADRWQERN